MQRTQILKNQCSQMLEALEQWLVKANERGDGSVSLGKRLAPDMYPLGSQVCFACFLVQEAVCRLNGKDVSKNSLALRQQGWEFDERPIELEGLISTITETRAQLASLEEGVFDQRDGGPIVFSLPDGMTFSMQCDEFLHDWTIPQFYFHLCIAYAIMRSGSVPLGKVDYVRHMLRYATDNGAQD